MVFYSFTVVKFTFFLLSLLGKDYKPIASKTIIKS